MDNISVLTTIRNLNCAILGNSAEIPSIDDLIGIIAESTESAVLLVTDDGKIIGQSRAEQITDSELEKHILKESIGGSKKLKGVLKLKNSEYNRAYSQGDSSRESKAERKADYCTVIPVPGAAEQLYLIFFAAGQEMIGDEQLAAAEAGAGIAGVIIKQGLNQEADDEERNRKLAEAAFDSLSYSEIEAIVEILKSLKDNESIIVASKIADRLGITRSVIVNALRKFESAGIIESRSLGMKGTFIKVKNTQALELVSILSAQAENMI